MLNKIFYKNYNPVSAVEAEDEYTLPGNRPGSLALSQGFSRHVFFSAVGFFHWVAVFVLPCRPRTCCVDQAGLELSDPPASCLPNAGLKGVTPPPTPPALASVWFWPLTSELEKQGFCKV